MKAIAALVTAIIFGLWDRIKIALDLKAWKRIAKEQDEIDAASDTPDTAYDELRAAGKRTRDNGA